MFRQRSSPRSSRSTVSLAAIAGSVLAIAVVVPALHARAQTTISVTCQGVDDTSAVQSAVKTAGLSAGNTVSIGAGTCALFAHIPVNGVNPVTITGATESTTILVEHSRINIFQITTPGTTIENLTADTGTFNTTIPPVKGSPDPATLFSNASNTTVMNYTSISGTGFGFRLTGPSPCGSHQVTGDLAQNVNVTNQGVGGLSSIDLDCSQSVTLSNATVHGGSVTPYDDAQSTIDGLTYFHSPSATNCQPAWMVTTGASHISHVLTYAGYGKELQGAVVTVSNEALAPGDVCPNRPGH